MSACGGDKTQFDYIMTNKMEKGYKIVKLITF